MNEQQGQIGATPLRANRLTLKKQPDRAYPVYRQIDVRVSRFEHTLREARTEIEMVLRRFAKRIEEQERRNADEQPAERQLA